MAINPQDQSVLLKYTMVAKKIIYEPARMSQFLKMMGTKEGAVQAVHTVLAGIDKLKPIPPQIRPYLGTNAYMVMVEVAQEVTGQQADPAIVKEVVGMILSESQGAAPTPGQPKGMLAQMQEQGEPAGDPTTPDDMPAHEGAEPPAMEQQEGAEEDPPTGMLARMQRRA